MAYELSRVVFTCPADSLVGDAVYISGVKTVSYADVDDAAKYANAVIMDKLSATTCVLSGRNSVIAGLAGLTAGSYYYLTNTATAGNTLSLVASAFIVALAISTTELRIELDAVIATHIAAANPHSGSAPTAHSHLDGEVDDGITLTNITQITNRSHTDLTDIGVTAHGGIDTHIGAANPHSGSQPLDAQLTSLAAFTAAEVSQLANIGVTTISAAQWGFLGGCSGIIASVLEDTTPQLGGELDFNNKVMNLNATAVSDNNATGIIINMTAGVQLDFPEVVCVNSNGDAILADADSSNTMPVIGMALETKNATETIKILVYGFVYDSGWNWAVGGGGETRLLYASVTPGGMSQTPPVGSGDQAQVVATVVEVDRILFNPSYVLVEIA